MHEAGPGKRSIEISALSTLNGDITRGLQARFHGPRRSKATESGVKSDIPSIFQER
jgi:hypothetical protein